MQVDHDQLFTLTDGTTKKACDIRPGDKVSNPLPDPKSCTPRQILLAGGGSIQFLMDGTVSWLTRDDGSERPKYVVSDAEHTVWIEDLRGSGYPPNPIVIAVWGKTDDNIRVAFDLCYKFNQYETQIRAVTSSSCAVDILNAVDTAQSGNSGFGIIPQRTAVERAIKKHIERAK